jgi:hypothetical protein
VPSTFERPRKWTPALAEVLNAFASALAAIAVFGALFAAVVDTSDPQSHIWPLSESSSSWQGALSDISSPGTETVSSNLK